MNDSSHLVLIIKCSCYQAKSDILRLLHLLETFCNVCVYFLLPVTH